MKEKILEQEASTHAHTEEGNVSAKEERGNSCIREIGSGSVVHFGRVRRVSESERERERDIEKHVINTGG